MRVPAHQVPIGKQIIRICNNLDLTLRWARALRASPHAILAIPPWEEKNWPPTDKSLALTVRLVCAAWCAALAASGARWMTQVPTPWTPRLELGHHRVSVRASAPSFTLIPGDCRCWWRCSSGDVAAALLRANLLQVKAPAPGRRRVDVCQGAAAIGAPPSPQAFCLWSVRDANAR